MRRFALSLGLRGARRCGIGPRILNPSEIIELGWPLYKSDSSKIVFPKHQMQAIVSSVIKRDLPIRETRKALTYQPEPRWASAFDRVRLLRQDDRWTTRFIFVFEGNILGPHIRDNSTTLDNPKRALRIAAASETRSEEHVLDVGFVVSMLEAGSNFGHFVFSHLPKLQHWFCGNTYSPFGPSILVDNPQTWHYDVLATLGVPRQKIIAVSESVREIRARRFVVTDEKYLGGRTPSFALENLQWLRSQFADKAVVNTPKSDIVYLEREATARRVVINTDNVRQLVGDLGGTTIQPITLPFREQVNAVMDRKIVLGTNGTELLLSVFASDAKVVSIVPPGPHMHAIMAAVALASGHSFQPVLCHNTFDPSAPADLRDMFVDPHVLRRALAISG